MLLFQVWVWMISIFLTTGLVLGVNWYKPQTKAASPTDMRIIGGLSSVFCYAVTIRSDDNITAYLLDSQRLTVLLEDMGLYQNTPVLHTISMSTGVTIS